MTVFLAEIFEQPENTLRERLRQWYFSSSEKKGKKRGQIDIEQSFVPLLRWILNWWSSAEKSLVFAADATTLGQRFTLLVISVVYRGSGIPVAWKVIPANEKGSWQPHWLKLLFLLSDGVPDGWWVIVTTDRGLYAPWLYEAIKQLGWHPFMRINHQGSYRFCDREQYQPPSSLPPLSEMTSDIDQGLSNSPSSSVSSSVSSLSIQNNSTRLLSCFRRGFLVLLASVIKRMPLPQGSFIPDFSPAPG